ncbi:MAG: DUF4143 domain-containing protein [Paludibacteraceae bacterium]
MEVTLHWAKGALFENMIMADLIKNYYNRANRPLLFFGRDNTGNEVDCLIDEGNIVKSIEIIEIKASTTINSSFFNGLTYYSKLNNTSLPYLVYRGTEDFKRQKAHIVSWDNINSIID